jgi:LacI family transcriptional regulator
MPLPRVTMRDIAKRAEVHVTTVSLALRNHPNLSLATRQRIQKLAQSMEYRPDPMLSALWAYRKLAKPVRHPLTLGYVTATPKGKGMKIYEAHQKIHQGAKEHAEKLGYEFQEYWLHEPGMTTKRWNKILTTRNLSGLIFVHSGIARSHIRLDWDRFCAVRIDPPLVWPRLHSIGNNQYRCMQIAVREARRHGYRKIGLAMNQWLNEHVDLLWSAGFLAEQHRHLFGKQIPMLISREWNQKIFTKWFLRHRPDVIVSQHIEILGWLKELGLKVPQDIGFIDLDCMDLTGARAGIHQHHDRVGAVAVEVLARMSQQNERGIPTVPQTILIDGSWVEGSTIRKAP